MVAWAATIPLFWSILGHNMKEGYLGIRAMPAGEFIFGWAWVLTVLTYSAMLAVIVIHFWDFWPTLL
jgi:hypothetical protein